MYSVMVNKNSLVTRDELRGKLLKEGIETREFFYPNHKQPALTKLGLFKNEQYPQSLFASKRGFYLPSGPLINEEEVVKVCDAIKKIYAKKSKYCLIALSQGKFALV